MMDKSKEQERKFRMNLDRFIDHTSTAILMLTDGNVHLSDLPDYSDGEMSLSEMYDSGMTPREAAVALLTNEGYPLDGIEEV